MKYTARYQRIGKQKTPNEILFIQNNSTFLKQNNVGEDRGTESAEDRGAEDVGVREMFYCFIFKVLPQLKRFLAVCSPNIFFVVHLFASFVKSICSGKRLFRNKLLAENIKKRRRKELICK